MTPLQQLDTDTLDTIRRAARRHNRRFLLVVAIVSVITGIAVILGALAVAALNGGM